jgi:hypothetical protein
MRNNQSIIIYLLTFLLISFILKLFNIINVSFTELAGYALIFYGINLVYSSFGNSKIGVLFTGTFLFLSGLELFLISNFDFARVNEIIFPSLLFILGICFLMLFLNETAKKSYFVISATFLFTGILVTVIVGSITVSSFLNTILIVASKYWPVALIVAGIILIIHRDQRGTNN